MGWAARANKSAETAKACGYQKPKAITLGRRFSLVSMQRLVRAARIQALLRRRSA